VAFLLLTTGGAAKSIFMVAGLVRWTILTLSKATTSSKSWSDKSTATQAHSAHNKHNKIKHPWPHGGAITEKQTLAAMMNPRMRKKADSLTSQL
jgi:hypothetical protein